MGKVLTTITLSLVLICTSVLPTLASDDNFSQSSLSTITTYILNTTNPLQVSKVTLNKKTLSFDIGFSETLIATVSPTTATNQNVTWKSSKASVATVDSEGIVTALKAGKTTITVTTVDGKKTAKCTVTVMSNTPSSLTAEMARHARVMVKLDTDYNKLKGIIEGQIQAIRQQYAIIYAGTEQQYITELTKLQTAAQIIQNRINALSNDNSSSGKAEKARLQKQLDALNVQIKALQDSHTAKVRIDALEKNLANAKIEYDKNVSAENALHLANLERLS